MKERTCFQNIIQCRLTVFLWHRKQMFPVALELFFGWGGSPDERRRHGFSSVGSDPWPQNLPTLKILFLLGFRPLDVVNMPTKFFWDLQKTRNFWGSTHSVIKSAGVVSIRPPSATPLHLTFCVSAWRSILAIVPLINKGQCGSI